MQLKNYSLLSDRILANVAILRYTDQVDMLLKMRADPESVGDDRKESRLASLFPLDFFDRFPSIFGDQSRK